MHIDATLSYCTRPGRNTMGPNSLSNCISIFVTITISRDGLDMLYLLLLFRSKIDKDNFFCYRNSNTTFVPIVQTRVDWMAGRGLSVAAAAAAAAAVV